jgi:hypothetical protein
VRRCTCAREETAWAASASWPSEQEREAAQVVEKPADALPVGDVLVDRLRTLGVRARQDPLALSLGDERGLKEDVRDGLPVVQALGQLERALDVLAGRLPVALAAVAAGAPLEDVCAQPIAGEPGAVGERDRLPEQRGRSRGR